MYANICQKSSQIHKAEQVIGMGAGGSETRRWWNFFLNVNALRIKLFRESEERSAFITQANLQAQGKAEFSILHSSHEKASHSKEVKLCLSFSYATFHPMFWWRRGFLPPGIPQDAPFGSSLIEASSMSHLPHLSRHASNCLEEQWLEAATHGHLQPQMKSMEKCLKCKQKRVKTGLKNIKIQKHSLLLKCGNISEGVTKGQASDVGPTQEMRDWFHHSLPLPWVVHAPPHFPACKTRFQMLETVNCLKIYSEIHHDFNFILAALREQKGKQLYWVSTAFTFPLSEWKHFANIPSQNSLPPPWVQASWIQWIYVPLSLCSA